MSVINIDECFDNSKNKNQRTDDDNRQAGGLHDDENRRSDDHDLPCHEERLSELHLLGVKVGTEVLTPAQAQKL